MDAETVSCVSCRRAIPRDARFCPECGAPNAAAFPGTAPTSAGTSPADAAGMPNSGFLTPEMSREIGHEPAAPRPYDSSQTVAYPTYAAPPVQPGQPSQTGQGQPTQYMAQAPEGQPYSPYNRPTQDFAPSPAPTQGLNEYPSAPPPQVINNYAQNPLGYQYQSQAGVAGTVPRDPTIALLLELLGYVGFLGIGHIYAGRVGRGVGIMIGWWVYWALSFALVIFIVGCLMMGVGLLVPILSGLWIRSEVLRDNGIQRTGLF